MSQAFLEATHQASLSLDTEDLVSRFLMHVSSSPDAIAVVTSQQTWTYQALYEEVLKWKVLLSQHVETRTVVFLNRTPRLISILLALQWLRVAYIPVDPQTPVQRLVSVTKDSQAQTLLHDDAQLLAQDFACVVLNVDHLAVGDFKPPKTLRVRPAPDELAYIIYTSGSTGVPKGVAITYRALNHFLACMSRFFLREEKAMLLAVTTIAFDIAQLELWLPLWQKRALFLTSQAEHRDPLLLKHILARYPITLLQSTPSLWTMLLAVGWGGQSGLVALSGGEALSQNLASELLDRVDSLWNMYGPTEATVWCAMKRILHSQTPITVGKPIEGMSFLVLDEERRQLPPGVKGELYIAGVGLAQGYVNREDLNHERFIFWEGLRLYRVGDIAMETADGEFIILGRTDHQVKLRGYRIELEEIEACIKQSPMIAHAAVAVVEEQLVGYCALAPEMTYSESELGDWLKQILPHYMIPARWIVLEALPLSLSGKVDRQALPKPSLERSSVLVSATDLESCLCAIWEKALHCPVSPLDNFFGLGGHSLIAARIVSEVGEKLGKLLTLDALYHAPTVRAFAALIECAPRCEPTHKISDTPTGWFALTDYQAMFWLSQRFEPGLNVFNVAARRRFQQTLNHRLLDEALAFVTQKHSVLSYRLNRFYPAQRLVKGAPIQWEAKWLSLSDRVDALLAASFDDLFYRHRWAAGQPMACAKLFYLPTGQTELQFCASHLIADEHALEIFFEDLCLAYEHYERHGCAPRQESMVSFDDYVLKANQRLQIKQEEKIDFWKNYLADTGYFPMSSSHVVPKMTGAVRDYVTEIDFPEALLDALRSFCVQHQLTLNDALTAAVGLTLQRSAEVCEYPILINTVKSARTEARLDETMGCFLEMSVIKLALNSSRTLLEAAKAAQRSWMETLPYQDVPSLIKYASLGQCSSGLGRLAYSLVRGVMACYGWLVREKVGDVRLFRACAEVARQERKMQFFVSVNVLGSFIAPRISSSSLEFSAIPPHPFHVMPLASVLDVWFYRPHGVSQPKLLIAGNLNSEFRDRFIDVFFDVLSEGKI